MDGIPKKKPGHRVSSAGHEESQHELSTARVLLAAAQIQNRICSGSRTMANNSESDRMIT